MFTALGWKNVRQIAEQANLNMTKQAMEGISSAGLNQTFKVSAATHQRGQPTTWVDHKGPASRKITNFDVRSATAFNTLPDELKAPRLTVQGFKNKLKNHVLTTHHLPHHG